MKRVLFIANHKGFSKFNAPYMQWFKDQGWIVDNASPGIEVGNVDHQYDIDIQRSPFSPKNITALWQLTKIIQENHYDIIHCHTPMGAALGRLAVILSRARKKGTKVVYTAHGFHFYKGAPAVNWLVYYPIERMLANVTDALVTINEEDYEFARTHRISKGCVYKIDGVGCNLSRFKPLPKSTQIEVRRSLGIAQEDFVILYTAQFINRKNHAFLLSTIPKIRALIPHLKVVLAGNGPEQGRMRQYAKSLNISDCVLFLGGRDDIELLCGMADIHVSTSVQEGLAMNNIEAMACGCPLVLSRIRGHMDPCKDGRNGFCYSLNNASEFIDYIYRLYKDESLREEISANNVVDAQRWSITNSLEAMAKIYQSVCALA